MPGIPELLTPRLRLRAFEPRDVDAYATMMADPEVTRYLGDGKPLSHADAWRQIALFLGHWALLGFGIWAVVERGLSADGSFVAVNIRISQSVPHLHVHVVQRRKKDGLRGFFWPRVTYADDAEREGYAARIRAAL